MIDVGANIGNHTVFFGKLLGRRVIALEPYELAFRVLEKNVELNGLSDKVTLLQKAAGRKSSRGEITPPPEHNWGQARVRATGSGPVEVIRLDDLAIRGPVALIKIDVEGMEADVLKGAWRLLKRKRPVLVRRGADASALRRSAEAVAADRLPDGASLQSYADLRLCLVPQQETNNRCVAREDRGPGIA